MRSWRSKKRDGKQSKLVRGCQRFALPKDEATVEGSGVMTTDEQLAVVTADRNAWATAYEECRRDLEGMRKARDLCKKDANDANERWQGVLRWLRDNHPEVYEEALEADA